jgi:hypothetical protein
VHQQVAVAVLVAHDEPLQQLAAGLQVLADDALTGDGDGSLAIDERLLRVLAQPGALVHQVDQQVRASRSVSASRSICSGFDASKIAAAVAGGRWQVGVSVPTDGVRRQAIPGGQGPGAHAPDFDGTPALGCADCARSSAHGGDPLDVRK